MKKIAILATGDEVVEGEILNTNTQIIAQKLTELGFYVHSHLSCRDDEASICQSVGYLLKDNDFIITIGGLGPTDDDITRFAIAKLLNLPLEFNSLTWRWIENRYRKLKLPIPQTNRQQALFPKGCQVLPNDAGSADGALMRTKGKVIVMLPGPPTECLPMIDKAIIPFLKQHFVASFPTLYKWRVFGISESLLAEKIQTHFSEEVSKDIAYRWHYPYIDVKYRHSNEEKALSVKANLDKFLDQYIICANDVTASALLKNIIKHKTLTVNINDRLTGGLLQTHLLTPEVFSKLYFNQDDSKHCDLSITLTGLEPYWSGETNLSGLLINIVSIRAHQRTKLTIDLKDPPLRVMPYVIELLSAQLIKILG